MSMRWFIRFILSDPVFVGGVIPEGQQPGHVPLRDVSLLDAHLSDGVQIGEADALDTGLGQPLAALAMP